MCLWIHNNSCLLCRPWPVGIKKKEEFKLTRLRKDQEVLDPGNQKSKWSQKATFLGNQSSWRGRIMPESGAKGEELPHWVCSRFKLFGCCEKVSGGQPWTLIYCFDSFFSSTMAADVAGSWKVLAGLFLVFICISKITTKVEACSEVYHILIFSFGRRLFRSTIS